VEKLQVRLREYTDCPPKYITRKGTTFKPADKKIVTTGLNVEIRG
jgi:hypothetical protein